MPSAIWTGVTGAHEFYNIPRAHYDECLEEVIENLPYWFAVIDENDRLLGFYEFSFHEEMKKRSWKSAWLMP